MRWFWILALTSDWAILSWYFTYFYRKTWFPIWMRSIHFCIPWSCIFCQYFGLCLHCVTMYVLTVTKFWPKKKKKIWKYFWMHLEEKWKMMKNYLNKNRLSQMKWSFIYMVLLWRHDILLRAKKNIWLDGCVLP